MMHRPFLVLLLALLPALPAAGLAQDGTEPDAPAISHDINALPAQVQRMRQRIIEAAQSGDIEELRPVIEMSELPPIFSFGDNGDPIARWREQSGDGAGLEILAIMLDVLDAGYVHLSPGTDHELYVWPYFYDLDLAALQPWQTVELYRLVTPEQHRDMIDFGGYHYYRLGIGPDGTWHFFVAGD